MNSQLLKAYKHLGVNYKLIAVIWHTGESISYLTKVENRIILSSHRVYSKNHWLVLSCFHPNIADEIKKHWQ